MPFYRTIRMRNIRRIYITRPGSPRVDGAVPLLCRGTGCTAHSARIIICAIYNGARYAPCVEVLANDGDDNGPDSGGGGVVEIAPNEGNPPSIARCDTAVGWMSGARENNLNSKLTR